jgi:hypothetical protein
MKENTTQVVFLNEIDANSVGIVTDGMIFHIQDQLGVGFRIWQVIIMQMQMI